MFTQEEWKFTIKHYNNARVRVYDAIDEVFAGLESVDKTLAELRIKAEEFERHQHGVHVAEREVDEFRRIVAQHNHISISRE